ncbi:glycine cleavage T-C-terminal barrel domain protein, partial [Mycobacterium xenopi 3993]
MTTSGTFSPTLKTGIALALIDTEARVEDGQHVTVDVRGAPRMRGGAPPFVEPKTGRRAWIQSQDDQR